MVGGELGSLLWASHLDLSLRLVFLFSFGYISPKFKVLCDPYSPGSTITKKGEKRTGRRVGPASARDSVSLLRLRCDATHSVGGIWGLEAV